MRYLLWKFIKNDALLDVLTWVFFIPYIIFILAGYILIYLGKIIGIVGYAISDSRNTAIRELKSFSNINEEHSDTFPNTEHYKK